MVVEDGELAEALAAIAAHEAFEGPGVAGGMAAALEDPDLLVRLCLRRPISYSEGEEAMRTGSGRRRVDEQAVWRMFKPQPTTL